MKSIYLHKGILQILISIIVLSFSSVAMSEYVPFPGKRKVRLINVDAANIVVVNFETWLGFARTLRIILPDLDVPGNSSKLKSCELELAKKAMEFTKDFVTSAKTITVQDMRMETSADEEAKSPINTDKGSLSQALIKAGLARSSSIDPDTPWCK